MREELGITILKEKHEGNMTIAPVRITVSDLVWFGKNIAIPVTGVGLLFVNPLIGGFVLGGWYVAKTA